MRFAFYLTMQKKIKNKAIVLWLLSGAVLILAMVVVGGITRLTGSGLSIVEWNLISGTLPPLSDAAWSVAFEKYKRFPEYQKLNMGMSLHEFKQIFFWEYSHRLLGRLIVIVFILPFLYFLFTKQLSGWLLRRLLFILLLGMAQGVMGWLMVKSGLVDNPHVSHFRLAAHLLLALSLIGVILYTVADLTTTAIQQKTIPGLQKMSWLVLAAILVQIILGAFVAGLKAGFSYNTYPLMNGEFFPAYLLDGSLTAAEILENGVIMQFVHRWFAVFVLVLIVTFWYRTFKSEASAVIKNTASLLLITAMLQFVLGVATLLLAVPISLGVLHQVMAVVLFSIAVLAMHHLQPQAKQARNQSIVYS